MADKYDMRELARLMDEAAQSIVPADLAAKGWRYVDPPTKFSFEMWDHFLSLIGNGEYRVIVYSEGPDWKRGQLLVSPQGMENLDRHRRERQQGEGLNSSPKPLV